MELCSEFYAYRLFPLLDLQYLDSCFNYNTRDVSRWVDESRMNHRKGKSPVCSWIGCVGPMTIPH